MPRARIRISVSRLAFRGRIVKAESVEAYNGDSRKSVIENGSEATKRKAFSFVWFEVNEKRA